MPFRTSTQRSVGAVGREDTLWVDGRPVGVGVRGHGGDVAVGGCEDAVITVGSDLAGVEVRLSSASSACPGCGLGSCRKMCVGMQLQQRARRRGADPGGGLNDLGLRKGFASVFGGGPTPQPDDVLHHGERWKPYRTTDTWYLWQVAAGGGLQGASDAHHEHEPRPRPPTKEA